MNSLRYVYVLFAGTFLFGVAVGVLIFLGLDFSQGSAKDVAESYTLIVSKHGSCRTTNSCLSYRLSSDGSYLLVRDVKDNETVRANGVVPDEIRTPFTLSLLETDMSEVEERLPYRPACVSARGDTYTIEYIYNGVTTYLSLCDEREVDAYRFTRDLVDFFPQFIRAQETNTDSL